MDSTKGLDVAAPDEMWCGYRADLLDRSPTYWSFDMIGGECVLLKKLCLWLKVVLRFLPVCAVSKVPFYAHLQENVYALSSSHSFSRARWKAQFLNTGCMYFLRRLSTLYR